MLVTTFNSTDFISRWHPQQIYIFALEFRWLRNFSTSAPYKIENHSGKRRRRAEGRLGNNQAQWVTARHSAVAMRNSLMSTRRRTGDSTLRSSRRDKPGEGNEATKFLEKEVIASFQNKIRTPRQLSIFVCFMFHMLGKLYWQYPAISIKSCALVI